ncbi:hypothetical protein D3C73_1331550 [compost metagenome]
MRLDGRKGREQLDEPQRLTRRVLGEEDHRFIPRHALGNELARLIQVRGLAVETPIGVEQAGNTVEVGGVGAMNPDIHGRGLREAAGVCRAMSINGVTMRLKTVWYRC